VASAAQPAVVEARLGGGPVVEVGVFRERLAPFGRWFTIPAYGYVWSPFNVAAGWGPYVDGSWVYSDFGWTWISDDPWGWATCHYGRWFFDPAYGWVWVPGTEWAPAWVDWMYGDGFIGWAPLSPAFVGFGGFVPISVTFFRFCRDRDFDRPHIGRFIVPTGRNAELFGRARRVTNFDRVNGVVVNRSLSKETIERAAGHKVEQRALNGVNSPEEIGRKGNRGLDRGAGPATSAGATNDTQTLKQQRKLERQQTAEQDRAARQQDKQQQQSDRGQARQQRAEQRATGSQQDETMRQQMKQQRQAERQQQQMQQQQFDRQQMRQQRQADRQQMQMQQQQFDRQQMRQQRQADRQQMQMQQQRQMMQQPRMQAPPVMPPRQMAPPPRPPMMMPQPNPGGGNGGRRHG